MLKELIIPDSGDGNLQETCHIKRKAEGIDNPRLRGRKLSLQFNSSTISLEGIDNPRLRGRKQFLKINEEFHYAEGIDNPRLRGRKLHQHLQLQRL